MLFFFREIILQASLWSAKQWSTPKKDVLSPFCEWLSSIVLFGPFLTNTETSPSVFYYVRISLEVRSEAALLKKNRRAAARRTCRVDLQQVPAACSPGNSWAGLWVWPARCAEPPRICPAACAEQHRPSLATWGTMPMTTWCCLSCWAWACPCCSFYKRYCCRCTQRPWRMGPAFYSRLCFGCRSRSGWFNVLLLKSKSKY